MDLSEAKIAAWIIAFVTITQILSGIGIELITLSFYLTDQ